MWTTIDAPWLKNTSESWLASTVNELRRMAPKAILSSHLPPAFGMEERFLEAVAAARCAPPFAGPDQAAFEAMLAERDAA